MTATMLPISRRICLSFSSFLFFVKAQWAPRNLHEKPTDELIARPRTQRGKLANKEDEFEKKRKGDSRAAHVTSELTLSIPSGDFDRRRRGTAIPPTPRVGKKTSSSFFTPSAHTRVMSHPSPCILIRRRRGRGGAFFALHPLLSSSRRTAGCSRVGDFPKIVHRLSYFQNSTQKRVKDVLNQTTYDFVNAGELLSRFSHPFFSTSSRQTVGEKRKD